MIKTVLTVEDSRTMRLMLEAALTEAGYRVRQAEDGVEGLRSLAEERPDVVITDINMPNLDGFGFIEKVRSDPANRALPILVLTTEGEKLKKDKARQLGATGWIVKPFDPAKLTDAIKRVTD